MCSFWFSLEIIKLNFSYVVFTLFINPVGSLHRYTYGIGWRDNRHCAHIDHIEFSTTVKKKKRQSSSKNRIAEFHLIQHLVQFPYGGRLCATHRIEIYSILQLHKSKTEELNTFSGIHSYEIEAKKSHELNNANKLLMSLEQSPLKSQAIIPLQEQSQGAIRYLTSKLRRAVAAAGQSFILIRYEVFVT